jgi:glutamyl-tRNA reductase
MKLAVVGISHHRAPIAIRERIAYREAELAGVVEKLKAEAGAQEAVLISTCNRVEAYLATADPRPPLESVRRFLEEDRGAAGIAEWFYAREGLEAVRHLFRVVSGLDSMVLGENEILGQVRRAYLAALQARTTGRTLNRIFQVALHVGKTVRSVTSISSGQLSVPSVAVGLAEKIFQDLGRRRGLVLGAGETGELTAAAFRSRGMRSFVVLNRTPENGRRLAERIGAQPDSLEALPRRMLEADVLISCAGADADSFLVSLESARQAAAARRGMPLLIVDIAVPRSVDPAIDGLESVYLYNIDDLQSIAAENAARRAGEVGRCEEIIRREADKILCAAIAADPQEVIARLRNHCDEIADEELRRAIRDMDGVGTAQREALERMVRRIVTKILHRPIQELKEGEEETAAAETLRRLFDLK